MRDFFNSPRFSVLAAVFNRRLCLYVARRAKRLGRSHCCSRAAGYLLAPAQRLSAKAAHNVSEAVMGSCFWRAKIAQENEELRNQLAGMRVHNGGFRTL